MRWRKRHPDHGEAQQAIADAQQQHDQAHAQTPKVDRTAGRARELTKRTDRFTREIERAWRPKESP